MTDQPLTVEERLGLLEKEGAGLRAAGRLALAGYGILVLVMVVVAIAISNHNARSTGRQIRSEINQLATAACKTSTREFIEKHNDLVREIVATRQRSAAADHRSGDLEQERIDRDAAARYAKKYIDVPTDKQCAKPILKP